MSNNPLLKTKLPYSGTFNSTEEHLDYISKVLNSSFLNSSISSTIDIPIGTIIQSMLTITQFQNIKGNGWILADGSSCVGSSYASITGFTVVPDIRGRTLRGKSYTSGNNPDGDLSLGTYQADMFANHNHTGGAISAKGFLVDPNTGAQVSAGTSFSGGNETRMKNITVNIFIRIN